MDRSALNAFDFLQSWYAEQCNEDWEHEFGIRIATVDNPGWSVEVDLVDTDLEGRRLEMTKQEGADGRRLWTWSDGEVFSAVCDGLSLARAVGRFRTFAEQAARSQPSSKVVSSFPTGDRENPERPGRVPASRCAAGSWRPGGAYAGRMGKRRVRRLVVGGDEYLWTGRIGYVRGPEVRRCVYLRILAGRRAALSVVMVSAGPLGPWGAATDCSYPTPGTVRAVLGLALAEGWDPRAPDPRFAMLGALDGWELYAPADEHSRCRLYQRLLGQVAVQDEPELLARILRDPDPVMAGSAVAEQLDRRAAELLGDPDAFRAWSEELARIGTDFHRVRLAEWELLRTVTAGEPWREADVLAATDRSQRQLAERADDPAVLELLARAGRTRRVRNGAAARLAGPRV